MNDKRTTNASIDLCLLNIQRGKLISDLKHRKNLNDYYTVYPIVYPTLRFLIIILLLSTTDKLLISLQEPTPHPRAPESVSDHLGQVLESRTPRLLCAAVKCANLFIHARHVQLEKQSLNVGESIKVGKQEAS
ncbi:hypothetical protein PoB_006226600 [Plakobranchus ocellatus]|uniref:Uncharacterized protein n=1 Tax=Plakobranchus ocellatus TaxID=259542 RepID=A0AAV4CVP3_9GAST|nr:hypothetical protein PoB_006226600 [Plakobranchus ocellatus]